MSKTVTVSNEVAAILAQLERALSAKPTTEPKAVQPKADVRYRTAKQIATGRARYEALWADLKKANPGVSAKELARANREALNACYAKGTRKTKAA